MGCCLCGFDGKVLTSDNRGGKRDQLVSTGDKEPSTERFVVLEDSVLVGSGFEGSGIWQNQHSHRELLEAHKILSSLALFRPTSPTSFYRQEARVQGG